MERRKTVKVVSVLLVVAMLFPLALVRIAAQPVVAVEAAEGATVARESSEETHPAPGEVSRAVSKWTRESIEVIIPGVFVGRLELRSFAEPLTIKEAVAIRNDVIVKAQAEGLLCPEYPLWCPETHGETLIAKRQAGEVSYIIKPTEWASGLSVVVGSDGLLTHSPGGREEGMPVRHQIARLIFTMHYLRAQSEAAGLKLTRFELWRKAWLHLAELGLCDLEPHGLWAIEHLTADEWSKLSKPGHFELQQIIEKMCMESLSRWRARQAPEVDRVSPREENLGPALAPLDHPPAETDPPDAADMVEYRTRTKPGPPYGVVTNHYWLYRATDDGCAQVDQFIVRQAFGMEPGYRAWGNEWENYWGIPRQDWGYYPLVTDLVDWEPKGEHEFLGAAPGGNSKTINTTGAETIAPLGRVEVALIIVRKLTPGLIKWLFPEPPPGVTFWDDSSFFHREGKWQVDFAEPAYRRTVKIEPGSDVRVIEKRAGTHHVLRLEAWGRFRYQRRWPWPDHFGEVTHVWSIDHDFGDFPDLTGFRVGMLNSAFLEAIVAETEQGFEDLWPNTDVVVHHYPTKEALMEDLSKNRIDVVLTTTDPCQIPWPEGHQFDIYLLLRSPIDHFYVITLCYHIREEMHFNRPTAASAMPARVEDYINYLHYKQHEWLGGGGAQ